MRFVFRNRKFTLWNRFLIAKTVDFYNGQFVKFNRKSAKQGEQLAVGAGDLSK